MKTLGKELMEYIEEEDLDHEDFGHCRVWSEDAEAKLNEFLSGEDILIRLLKLKVARVEAQIEGERT